MLGPGFCYLLKFWKVRDLIFGCVDELLDLGVFEGFELVEDAFEPL